MAHASLTMKLIVMLSLSSFYLGYASSPAPDHLSFSLTHRDAEGSPLRSVEADPADLPEDLPMRASVAAGRALVSRFNLKKRGLHRPLLEGRLSYAGAERGDFYLTVPVGTPAQKVIFLMDTGSEFPYTQCSPCVNCTSSSVPRFAYKKSSSFNAVTCGSLLCRNSVALTQTPSPCKEVSDLCTFGLAFGDNSSVFGLYGVEAFDLGPKLPRSFVFGCAIVVQETVLTPSAGLLGLDAGPFSFSSQLFSSSPTMPKKFAHCLPDRFTSLNTPGRIEFGNYKQPRGMKYTPFAPPYSPVGSVYYFVQLQGITVGHTLIKVPITRKGAKGIKEGGTIFDSGSEITTLATPLYETFLGEVRKQTAHFRPFDGSTTTGFDLCYKIAAKTKDPPKVPKISLHFAGGINLELGPGSVVVPTQIEGDKANSYFCLAFSGDPSVDALNIIGNYQQQNYWVEYNLETSHLGLAKANCAQYK